MVNYIKSIRQLALVVYELLIENSGSLVIRTLVTFMRKKQYLHDRFKHVSYLQAWGRTYQRRIDSRLEVFESYKLRKKNVTYR